MSTAMQGSPPCGICTAVRDVARATYQSACSRVQPHARVCRYWDKIIHTQLHTCWLQHMRTHARIHTTARETLQSCFTPSCSQALIIGLTWITLTTLPIQLDYTFDSAFIHLYCAHRHTISMHTLAHHILLIVILCLLTTVVFGSSSLLRLCCCSCCTSAGPRAFFSFSLSFFWLRLCWPNT